MLQAGCIERTGEEIRPAVKHPEVGPGTPRAVRDLDGDRRLRDRAARRVATTGGRRRSRAIRPPGEPRRDAPRSTRRRSSTSTTRIVCARRSTAACPRRGTASATRLERGIRRRAAGSSCRPMARPRSPRSSRECASATRACASSTTPRSIAARRIEAAQLAFGAPLELAARARPRGRRRVARRRPAGGDADVGPLGARLRDPPARGRARRTAGPAVRRRADDDADRQHRGSPAARAARATSRRWRSRSPTRSIDEASRRSRSRPRCASRRARRVGDPRWVDARRRRAGRVRRAGACSSPAIASPPAVHALVASDLARARQRRLDDDVHRRRRCRRRSARRRSRTSQRRSRANQVGGVHRDRLRSGRTTRRPSSASPSAARRVPLTAHASLYAGATSAACRWQLPLSHYLESWGDARAWDGTAVADPAADPAAARHALAPPAPRDARRRAASPTIATLVRARWSAELPDEAAWHARCSARASIAGIAPRRAHA